MKTSDSSIFSAACLLTLSSLMPIGAAVITFDSATDYSNNFNESGAAPAYVDAYSYSASTGIGGNSGRIDVVQGAAGDTTASYKTSSYDLTTGTGYTTYVFFRTPSTFGAASGGIPAMIGFSEADNQPFLTALSQDWIAVAILAGASNTNFTMQGRYANNGTQTSLAATTAFTLNVDTWYKLAATFTDKGVTVGFNYSATVEDYGSNGTSLVGSVMPLSGTDMNQTSLSSSDTTAYGAFRTNTNGQNKVVALDNYFVIPEPSIFALLLGGLGTLVFNRRRVRLPG